LDFVTLAIFNQIKITRLIAVKDPLSGVFKEIVKVPETIWKDVESSTMNLVEWLVKRGNLSAEDAKAILQDLSDKSKSIQSDLEQRIDYFIAQSFKPFSTPKRENIIELRQKINSLFDKVDSLEAAWSKKQGGSEE